MKYYCIGIKGAGMSTLAQILFDLGNEVSGYDDYRPLKYTEEGLKKRGIDIYYDDSYKIDKDVIVTYSPAFSTNHKEIQRMINSGVKIKAYHELLGDLSRMFETVSIAGTHGKTTTSMMLKTILEKTVGCNYFIGDGSGYADIKNKLFVLESCEYQKHFLAYDPTYTIITNIELEHTECYDGINDIINTFNILTNKTKNSLILCGDDQNILKLNLTKPVLYYGFNDNNDVQIINLKMNNLGSSFEVIYQGQPLGTFVIPVVGRHMVLNATACITFCHMLGISLEAIKGSLKTFVNAKRRFKEEKITNDQIDNIIVDDYAHHPTELRVTLEAARAKYPYKELVAVFLPNTYSRTEAFLDDFIKALNLADKSYVMDIECDRERQEDYREVSSDNIIRGLINGEKISIATASLLLKHRNSVICFMSCAGIYKLIDEYKRLVK